MFCSKCGNQINQGEKFCSSCGNPIEIIETTQPKIDIPKPEKTEEQVNKKVIVPIAIIALMIVVGLISLVVYLGTTAPEREMKEAFETKDYYTVIATYEKLVADGEHELANQMMSDYINDTTVYLNNSFTMSIEGISDDDEIIYEISTFLNNNFGNIFDDEYGLLCNNYLWEIETIGNALEKLVEMIESKCSYYQGLLEMNNPDGSDEIFYYRSALSSFNSVIAEDVNYETAIAKSEEIYNGYVNILISRADELMKIGDYSGAITFLNDAAEELGQEFPNDDIETKFDEILSMYAAQYATKAEEEFKEGDINAAIGNIEAAISIYPNSDYKVKLEEYKSYLPFELYKENNVLKKDGTAEFDIEYRVYANDGTEMKNCMSIGADYKSVGSATYALKGKYDIVIGTYFISRADKNEAYTSYFEAYGDGKLLYTSPKIKAGVLPQEISFSVKGVQTLEIRWYGIAFYSWESTGYISDFVAKKNIPTETTE